MWTLNPQRIPVSEYYTPIRRINRNLTSKNNWFTSIQTAKMLNDELFHNINWHQRKINLNFQNCFVHIAFQDPNNTSVRLLSMTRTSGNTKCVPYFGYKARRKNLDQRPTSSGRCTYCER